MGKLLKILAVAVPLLAFAAYAISPEVRSKISLTVIFALIIPWWIVLFVVRLATVKVPEEQLAAMNRSYGHAGDAAQWPLAKGVITRFQNTGIKMGKKILVEFELTVAVEGHPPYTVTHKQVVPQLAEGRIAPGVTLAVRANPVDKSQVFIEWDKTFPGVMPAVSSFP